MPKVTVNGKEGGPLRLNKNSKYLVTVESESFKGRTDEEKQDLLNCLESLLFSGENLLLLGVDDINILEVKDSTQPMTRLYCLSCENWAGPPGRAKRALVSNVITCPNCGEYNFKVALDE